MFKIGDLIIYSAHGVCRVDDMRENIYGCYKKVLCTASHGE